MKKSHSYDELSKKPCIDCGKFLKLRIVEQNPKADCAVLGATENTRESAAIL